VISTAVGLVMNCDSCDCRRTRGSSTDRLGVDQVVRHQFSSRLGRDARAPRAPPARGRPELVFRQFADAANAALPRCDVVDLAAPLRSSTSTFIVSMMSSCESTICRDSERPKRLLTFIGDTRQVVVSSSKNRRLNNVSTRLRRRLARPHHPIDGDARAKLVDRSSTRSVFEMNAWSRSWCRWCGSPSRSHAQLAQQLLGELVVGIGQHLAGVAVDDAAGQHAAIR